MAIDSCDHGDFIVVYEIQNRAYQCPVCELEKNIKGLESEIEDLKEAE